jgi:hypothetical protein
MIWWAGAILAMAAAVAMLAVVVFWSIRSVDYAVEHIRDRGKRDGWEWQKNKLRSAAWWFSEDEPTRMLLADLAEMNEWEARDKWRKRRAEERKDQP